MSAMTYFFPFLSLVPLSAVSTGRKGVWVSVGVTAAVLASALVIGASVLSVLATLPVLTTSTVAALSFVRTTNGRREEDSSDLDTIESRRDELKVSVAEAERQEAQALQIYGIAKSLAASLSWEEMGPRLAGAVQRLFGSFEYLLYAMDETGTLTLLQRRGTWKREPPVDSVPEEAVILKPPVVVESVPVLAVSIRGAEGGASGILYVKATTAARRESDLIQTGAEVGPQLGMALSKALLFRQLETQSRTDGLTGTLRRQAFSERMKEEFKRAAVFRSAFSVLMIDIDHFKSVNDTHGHPAGDAVLARIGKILTESFYETDVVARYGGEEFVVLLPRSESEGVLRKAEALRQRIAAERVQGGFGQLQVTVSIGVARYPEGGDTPEKLIASADRALYRAKESGRNRIVQA